MRASLTLTELDGDYSIIRLSPEAPLPLGISDLRDTFVSITRTSNEDADAAAAALTAAGHVVRRVGTGPSGGG